MCYLISYHFLFSNLDVCSSSEYKLVNQPVLLKVFINHSWHLTQCWTENKWGWSEHIWLLQTCGSTSLTENFTLWWTGNIWGWPEPYKSDKGQIWWFEIIDERLSLQKIPCGRSKRFPRKALSKSTWCVAIAHFLYAYTSKWV